MCFAVHPLSLTNGVPRQKMCACVCVRACLCMSSVFVVYVKDKRLELISDSMLLVSAFIIVIFFNFLIFFLNPLPSYSVESGSNNTFIQAACCVASLVHNYGYYYSKG